MQTNGYCGMIVPMSGHSTERMSDLVKHFYKGFQGYYLLNISADAHPSMLFEGVKFRLAIFINSNSLATRNVSKFSRWYAEERNTLFSLVAYNTNELFVYKNIIPKITNQQHISILNKINGKKTSLIDIGTHKTYYYNTPIHWIRAHNFMPYFHSERDGQKASTQLKAIYYKSKIDAEAASSVLCSSLFFIWWILISDCYHLNKPELTNFKFDFNDTECVTELSHIYERLKLDLMNNSVRRIYNYKTSGRVEYDEYYMKKSKPIIDEIDTVLAKHYGFTDEELDFIINYDIKYRMGKEMSEPGFLQDDED